MTDDMGYDLKLPQVGELTFQQWQDWLARYDAVLGERDRRIKKLEEALQDIINLSKGMKYLLGFTPADIAKEALGLQKTYRGQQDDSALKADHLTALSAEDIRKMNHE